jgi:transposase-like protein
MVLISVLCPHCQSDQIIKGGKTKAGKQRYKCQNTDCPHYSFQRDLLYTGRLPAIKAQIVDRALNASGIRETARVLKISPTTVINERKKSVDAELCEPPCAHPVDPGGDGGGHPARRGSRSR